MTQEMLLKEVKQVRDPEAIAALYSYILFLKSNTTQRAKKPYSWSDIIPLEAKSGWTTREMTDWGRS